MRHTLTLLANHILQIVLHNGSNYDIHLIIKELANEFRENIHCKLCDKEKYKTFSIPIKYVDNAFPLMIMFIDSNNFMMVSLESHVNNLLFVICLIIRVIN